MHILSSCYKPGSLLINLFNLFESVGSTLSGIQYVHNAVLDSYILEHNNPKEL